MWKVYLLLGVVTVIAGLTPIGARLATAELPPLTIAFVRFGSAGLLLAITGKLLGLEWSFEKADWPMLIALGAICVPVNQVGFLFGVKLANASHAGIAYALVPVFVFWISLSLRRTSLSARMILASTLAFAGAVAAVASTGRLLIDHADTVAPTQWGPRIIFGDALLLTAAASWAVFVVFSQPMVKRLGAIQVLTAVFLIGAAFQAPLVVLDFFFFDLRTFDPSAVTWQGVAGLGFITLITAYTNYLLWYLIIARFDVTRSAVVTNTAFLVTVLAEAFLLQQPLSGWVAVGSVVLLAGIVLATRRPSASNRLAGRSHGA